MFSFPPSGHACVAGSRGQLSGHGPAEQQHARVWKENTPGAKGECVLGIRVMGEHMTGTSGSHMLSVMVEYLCCVIVQTFASTVQYTLTVQCMCIYALFSLVYCYFLPLFTTIKKNK